MFKDVEELKNFILWAKNQKIKRLKLGDYEAEFSDLVYVEQLQEAQMPEQAPGDQQKEDEELLYWSSRT